MIAEEPLTYLTALTTAKIRPQPTPLMNTMYWSQGALAPYEATVSAPPRTALPTFGQAKPAKRLPAGPKSSQ